MNSFSLVRVYIDSGTHIGRGYHQRIQRIEENIGTPELVLAEGDSNPLNRESVKAVLGILPFAPLLAVAVSIQLFLILELGGRLLSIIDINSSGSDRQVVRHFNQKEIKSKEIDLNIAQFVHRCRLYWAVSNWGALLPFLWLTWPCESNFFGIPEPIVYLILIGYLLFFILLAIAHEARNIHFAETIADQETEFGSVCAVMGGTHHLVVGPLLDKNEEITVINPKPENPSILTRISATAIESLAKILPDVEYC